MAVEGTLGIIGSSGGSALAAADTCLRKVGIEQRWVVVTDRACGLADWTQASKQLHIRICHESRSAFSEQAARALRDSGVTRVLLFYTRLVGAELFSTLDICNIHPSLLPDLPGLGAVRRAVETGRTKLGATLHRVDQGVDTGEILAQAWHPLNPNMDLAQAGRMSFAQKVLLTLLWQQCVWPIGKDLAQPIAAAFSEFLAEFGLQMPIWHGRPPCV